MQKGTVIILVPVGGAGIVAAGVGAFLLTDVIGVVFSIIFWVCAAGTIIYGISRLAGVVSGNDVTYGIAAVFEPVAEVFAVIVWGMLCILGAGLATMGLFLVGLWLLQHI